MKIVLATGIYPPDIGGPATYVQALAEELIRQGHGIVVITYENSEFGIRNSELKITGAQNWTVIGVSRQGGPLLRWWRYSRALRKYESDADIVYAFSSVSCGIPLRIAKLKKPKKVLRLGGDFLWERYTDKGGRKSLRELYETVPGSALRVARWLLRPFGHIVFSSAFQRDLYAKHYRQLPPYSVIENAAPGGIPIRHEKQDPLRLLFLGRLVRFKNLPTLLDAVAELPRVVLTIAGSGPMETRLKSIAQEKKIEDRIHFIGDQHGAAKQKLFLDHDLLVLPSLTEISPNVALEARAVGMPVLLTDETGLSIAMTKGMVLRRLRSAEDIVAGIREMMRRYGEIAGQCGMPSVSRPWQNVASEHLRLFENLR